MSTLRQVSLALCSFAVIAGGCQKKPASFQLDNGLRVDLVPTSRGDKAALAILFDVGADHDPPGRSGMAHLVEHLFATSTGPSGTPGRARSVESRTGAAYTLSSSEVLGGRILEEIDDAAFRMSRQAATKEADLTRVRKRVLEELAAQEHDPVMAAMHRAAESLRPSRGGGARGGVAAEVEAMTLAEVDAFQQAHYGAATARLVIAGRFDVAEAEKRIRTAFAKLPAVKPPQPRAPAGSRVTGTLVMGDAPQAMALAVAVPDVKDPLYPAFVVLAARLTGAGNGAQSERTWKVDFAPFARPDVLWVKGPIPAGQQPEAAAERVRKEVSAIVGAPPAGDDSVRALARYGGALGITPADEARETAFVTARRAQLGVDTKALEAAIKAVTPDQLTAAARLFDGKSSTAVLAGGKL
jgi:zinc protease